MLELSDITVRYGPFLAVDSVSLRVDEGEIVGLVGPNGAGKSSLVKTVGGVVRPMAGRVVFAGRDLASAFPWCPKDAVFSPTCRSRKTC
jgi:branched-chain amino acid transport system ATP-binding protein